MYPIVLLAMAESTLCTNEFFFGFAQNTWDATAETVRIGLWRFTMMALTPMSPAVTRSMVL
jgi:hypothetical protein